MGYGNGRWIELAQDDVQRRALILAIQNIRNVTWSSTEIVSFD